MAKKKTNSIRMQILVYMKYGGTHTFDVPKEIEERYKHKEMSLIEKYKNIKIELMEEVKTKDFIDIEMEKGFMSLCSSDISAIFVGTLEYMPRD